VPGTDLLYTYIAKGRYWRFRHKLTGDVALPHVRGLHWSLQKNHAELLDIVERRAAVKPASTKSFAWLIKKYRNSPEFEALANETQRDYGRTLDLLNDALGEEQFAIATKTMLKVVRDAYSSTPRKAHKIKQTLSRLYSWAEEQELVPDGMNPAATIKKLKRKGGDQEIVVWSDEEIDLFLKACPQHVLTPVLIALYTGQRREDIVNMRWTQFQGNIVRVRQSKTTALLDIACHTVLRKHLDGLTRNGDKICHPAETDEFTANGLSQALRRAVTLTEGMPRNRSMHGLRYAAGSRMQEAGCTVAEIQSVLGHNTYAMAMKYATQRTRAESAAAKMEGQGK
jgi:integrase